jgi:NAD(P)-dependent dehydrogenase (short-subunit alcohol dehydrogenase family)
MRLIGKHAIVTGAGSGIGRAVALGFAREGAGVVAADVDAVRARETALAIEEAGGQAAAVQVDVSSKASVEALLGAALARFERIDVLFNNAGVSSRAPLVVMSVV